MPLHPLSQNRWLRRLLWLVLAWLGLWALAWLAVPALLKSQVQTRASAALGRVVTIGAVDFKPWTLELSLSDVRIASADGRTSQLAIQRLYADASIQSLWQLAPVVDAVAIEGPQLTLTHRGDGHYDVDDVLQRLQSAPGAAAASPLRFALHNLVLSQGGADFVDQRAGAQRVHQLRNLRLVLPFLSTFDSQREITVQPQLAFELNGSTFDSTALGTPFAPDAQGHVRLQITHLDAAPYLAYWPAELPVRPTAAVLDGTIDLAFANAPVRKLALSGDLQLAGLRLEDKAGAPLLSVQTLRAVVTELRPLEHLATLSALTVDVPTLALGRNPAGAWTLVGAPAAAPATAAAPAGTPPAWQLGVDHMQVRDGRLRLHDASVSPLAQWDLQDTRIDARGLHWPLTTAADFEASAKVQMKEPVQEKVQEKVQVTNLKKVQARKPARITLQGSASSVQGSATARVSDGDLALVAPYLAGWLLPRASGMLDAELAAQWKDGALQLQAPHLALQGFALAPPAGDSTLRARDLPTFERLEARNLAVNLPQRAVTLDTLSLRGASVRLARGTDGQWMYRQWLVPAPVPAPVPAQVTAPLPVGPQPAQIRTPGPQAPPWTLAMGALTVDTSSLRWVDRQPAKPVFLELSHLQTQLRKTTLDGKSPMPLTLSAQVRSASSDPGTLRFDGSVMWDPLQLQGALDAKQFPAQALAPYGMGHVKLDLLRADTSFKGQVRYAQGAGVAGAAGATELHVQGDGSVQELQLNSALKSASGEAQSEELLTWKALSVPGIDLHLTPGQPLQLKLREVSLSDLYARLIINPEGRLVLQDLTRRDDGDPASPPPAASTTSTTTSTTAPTTASTPTPPGAASAKDPVIEVGTIRLLNGHVAFSDRFIKPNYSADLTELAGSLSGFHSQRPQGAVQMADLELHGRAEGTASLDITGRVNPLAKPVALDINAQVHDLELSPLSSYAAKYAGYGIERGRLSVDLHYAVNPEGQLQARNKIVLHQLVFGDAVAGATSPLPIKLAAALLADSQGVIDLDVPLSGSLNDPQFSVWPLVWKVLGNVITQALTSPFRLLGRLGTDTDAALDTLATVGFDAGTATLRPAALPGLNQVAQALRDKDSLRLTLEGNASLEQEGQAMRRERLNAMLLAEKRRQAASAGQDVTAVLPTTASEYPALLQAVYQRSDLKKPRNLLGLSRDLPVAQMEELLLASVPVDDDAVRQLALNRSLAVREYLRSQQVPSERLFLGVLKTAPTASAWQPQVELSLETR